MSDIEDLREIWKIKHQRIDKENRKRTIVLIWSVVVDILAVLLVVLSPSDDSTFFIISMIMIGGACGICLFYNRIIYKRIQKIIWEDKTD